MCGADGAQPEPERGGVVSKEVTITPICGGVHDEKTVATVEHVITLDNRKPTMVDMCGACDQAITDLIVRFIEDGEPVEQPKSPRKAPQIRPMHGKAEGLARFKGTVGNFACGWVDLRTNEQCPFRSKTEQGRNRHRTVQGHEPELELD